MMASAQHFEQRLIRAAAALGIELDEARTRQLLAYMEQLQRWNKTYNLTAIRDAEQMLVQHLFDSLAVVIPMQNALDRSGRGSAARIVDVGSGAGLPGVVLAIARPDWKVHCVDAVEKKTAFIRQMAGVLGLSNLHAEHARIEALPPLMADIVVSRAFASLTDFAILAGGHVNPQGHLLAMKGREPDDEIGMLARQSDWRLERVDPLHVPELDARRCLVWMNRRQGTL